MPQIYGVVLVAPGVVLLIKIDCSTSTGTRRLLKMLLIMQIKSLVMSCLIIFTALHVMQTRYSEENSVRLSVCHTREL